MVDRSRLQVFDVFAAVFAEGDVLRGHHVLAVLPAEHPGFDPGAIAHRDHVSLALVGDGQGIGTGHFLEEIVRAALAVEVEQGLGIAARIQAQGSRVLEENPVNLAIVDGRHVAVPDQDVVVAVFDRAANDMRMRLLEDFVL